ncbi:putative hydro-lyase [Nesterenkonia sphaerica]|uniref:Putative hydro-lyase FEF27_08045 n=1 Tax=Nesterenkonia sphaerica TaxID=1804988 RepID=A0A5R9AC45_9MICC|nr:putative hydro-lyase [Nesterenkonia sphaerica]TLP75595.1 putative hydro-lyase [Nesterenkonia sphaerica]
MTTIDGAAPAQTTPAQTTPAQTTPGQARAQFRAGLRRPTSGYSAGYAQVNLIAVPQQQAFDMLLFAQRNPKSCPVLGVLEAGQYSSELLSGGDIRTDIPAYRVYRHGELVDEPDEVTAVWREDLVAFLIGCSFTFEAPLLEAGLPVAHLEQGRNVPMYVTDRPCQPAGTLSGPLVVSMRPFPPESIAAAVRITSRYPGVHGAPVHIGAPEQLGITDLQNPDFGSPVDIPQGWTPVFWACGVTPQAAVMHSAPELAISHAPGHMLITDLPNSQLQVP